MSRKTIAELMKMPQGQISNLDQIRINKAKKLLEEKADPSTIVVLAKGTTRGINNFFASMKNGVMKNGVEAIGEQMCGTIEDITKERAILDKQLHDKKISLSAYNDALDDLEAAEIGIVGLE